MSSLPLKGPGTTRGSIHQTQQFRWSPFSRRSALWTGTLLPLLFLLPSPSAFAYDYGREIVVENAEDLYELYTLGDLSEEETERLVTLLQKKLDLNKATVEELFALPSVSDPLARAIQAHRLATPFNTVDEVLKVPGMTPEILAQIKSFVRVRGTAKIQDLVGKTRVATHLDGRVAYDFGDTPEPVSLEDAAASGRSYHPSDLGLDQLPEAFLRARVDVMDRVKLGAVTTFGEGPANFTYNQDRESFELQWGRPLVGLNKGYVQYDDARFSVIAGSYSVGFGEHLVFDETRAYQTNGFLPDDDVYGSESISVPQRLFGVAATWRSAALGKTSLEVTGFVSRRRYDLYQYDFVLPHRLADDPDNASNVVLIGEVPVYPVSLPNAYQEQLAGLHALARLDKRNWLGVSGYYGSVIKDFDFQFTSGMPTRDSYGALGVHFGASLWKVLLTGELSMMDNLSTAFLLRGVLDLGRSELMATVYGYGADFDNPHSRGFSDADTWEGKRDRDEIGVQVRGVWKVNRKIVLRATEHLWNRPEVGVSRMSTQARLDLEPVRKYRVSLLASWKDKDLLAVGRNRNYSSGTTEAYTDIDGDFVEETDTSTETVAEANDEPNGARARFDLRFLASPLKKLVVEAVAGRIYEDASYIYYNELCEPDYGWQIGQDLWLRAAYQPFDGASVSGRLRYLDEDVYGDGGERTLAGYLQYSQRLTRANVRLRYSVSGDLKDEPLGVTLYCEQTGDPNCPANAADVTPSDTAGTTPGVLSHVIQVSFETRF